MSVVGMRGRARVVVGTLAFTACVFGVSVVAVGSALAGEPTGDFAIFKQCPRFSSSVKQCLYARTLAGSLTLGGRSVPFTAPVTLQGGSELNLQTGTEAFTGALNGETLSRTPERIPGGLLGQPLYATLELAEPASEIKLSKGNLIIEEGTGLSLEVRLHLESQLLGGECYIGSHTRPIVLNLTTGKTSPSPPNAPISGGIGELSLSDEETLLAADARLVDNAFAVPAATGCGRDPALFVVDSALGLPSPAGHNSIVEQDKVWEATKIGVIHSER
jgi:hypothetical protein